MYINRYFSTASEYRCVFSISLATHIWKTYVYIDIVRCVVGAAEQGTSHNTVWHSIRYMLYMYDLLLNTIPIITIWHVQDVASTVSKIEIMKLITKWNGKFGYAIMSISRCSPSDKNIPTSHLPKKRPLQNFIRPLLEPSHEIESMIFRGKNETI